MAVEMRPTAQAAEQEQIRDEIEQSAAGAVDLRDLRRTTAHSHIPAGRRSGSTAPRLLDVSGVFPRSRYPQRVGHKAGYRRRFRAPGRLFG